MTTQEITEKLTKIIHDQLGARPESIKPESRFIEDLQADSLDCVELLIAVEDEFAINIDEDKAEAIKTVGQAVELIQKLV